MSYSTQNAIRLALEKVLTGLTPTGNILRRKKYRRASTAPQSWDSKAKADLDREFWIEEVTDDSNMVFGGLTDLDVTGTFVLSIGHSKTGDQNEGAYRRDTDLLQIRKELEKKGNFPTAVWLIRRASKTMREIENYWISTLTFNILYSVQAP